ncbi:MAG TPA: LssY C-terminal domain-containing protein [Candidatus Acidoferrales bacterium]|nr:LssY C-terminal domain-containing protein [Candidatus Acidoferrales bacterium]
MKILKPIALALALSCAVPPAHAQPQQSASSAASASSSKSYDVDIDASKQWVDTNIDLRAGEKIHFTATGTITYPATQSSKSKERSFGPDGLSRSFTDLIHQYAAPDAGHGALIGRLGTADAGGQPFLVGASSDFEAPVANRLFLGINQSQKDGESAQGSFHVTIAVVSEGSATAAVGGPAESRIPGITQGLLDQIPRRVSDPQGNPGDMVNVLLLGTDDQVVGAFKAAGWVQVDSSVQDTVLTGLLDSFEKKDYLTMPMSRLFLFGRPQDYGFAHAEPVRVVMSRNHLRVWKSPYSANGKTVWCVAATHDIGFERDQRKNSVTHKIDPAIDGEREFVNSTLSSTGLVIARDHVTPSGLLTQAKTATGGEFHSDGRILVLALKSETTAASSN